MVLVQNATVNNLSCSMKILLYILLLLPFSVVAQPAQVAKLTNEAKALEQQLNEEAALQRYLEVLKLDPNNFDATWNTSFLSLNNVT